MQLGSWPMPDISSWPIPGPLRARLQKQLVFLKRLSNTSSPLPQTLTTTPVGMSLDGDGIVHRITHSGFCSLTDEEQLWVIEMTKTRHPHWDPLIQEAYLHTTD
jgi:hypothetical protein